MQEDNKVRNVELAYLGLCLKGVQPNELNLTQEVLSIGRMTRRFVQSAWTIAMGRSCVTSGRKTS